jgi:hypothetical protein
MQKFICVLIIFTLTFRVKCLSVYEYDVADVLGFDTGGFKGCQISIFFNGMNDLRNAQIPIMLYRYGAMGPNYRSRSVVRKWKFRKIQCWALVLLNPTSPSQISNVKLDLGLLPLCNFEQTCYGRDIYIMVLSDPLFQPVLDLEFLRVIEYNFTSILSINRAYIPIFYINIHRQHANTMKDSGKSAARVTDRCESKIFREYLKKACRTLIFD